jgi:hypothetical protein
MQAVAYTYGVALNQSTRVSNDISAPSLSNVREYVTRCCTALPTSGYIGDVSKFEILWNVRFLIWNCINVLLL